MAAFPTTVATDSDLYIAVNARSTQLTDNPLTAGATTVNVLDTTGFPTVGFISIDNEIIKYTGTTGTSFTGCTRAADGTSATSHVLNSQVFHNVIAAHHNAVKDDLIAAEQFISDIIGRVSTQVRAPDGTASLPGISFASQTNMGFHRNSSSRLSAIVNNVLVWDFQQTENDSRVDLFVERNQASSTVGLFVSQQDNSSSTSHARAKIMVGGGSAGDPHVLFTVTGITDVHVGLDNDGSDDLCVGYSTTVGSGLRAKFKSNGQTELYANNTLGLQLGESAGQVQVRVITSGTLAAPALTIGNDNDTGLFLSGANQLDLVSGGALAIRLETPGNGVSIIGTTSGVNAAAGFVGQHVESIQNINVNSPGTNQWFDITSISLTAGDWDVWIISGMNTADYTTCTDIEFGIGTVAGNTAPGGNAQLTDWVSMSWGAGHLGKINQTFYKRFNLTSTTTLYSKALFTFTAGTKSGISKIWARRVR